MRKLLLTFFCLALVIPMVGFAQQGEGIPGAEQYRIDEATGLPDFVRFQSGQELAPSEFDGWAKSTFKMGPLDDFQAYRTLNDDLGFTHTRHHQMHAGKKVFLGTIITHERAGEIVSVNGRYIPIDANVPTQPSLTEANALNAAISAVGAQVYMWELPDEEEFLKVEQEDPNATFFPKGELTYILNDAGSVRLAWKFDIFAHEPMSRADVFIDAMNGTELFRNSRMMDGGDHVGTAVTEHSGTQQIYTDSLALYYVLHDSVRGGGIFTRNMENRTNFGSAVEFQDADNYWNNANANLDQYAGDAHWGGEMFYDFYDSIYSWKSYNNNDGRIRLYIHYGNDFDNATWDGQRARFGDGAGNSRPACVMDVVAHEMTHGVINNSADLVYQNEPGALNESFADIFGVMVERYARPNDWNWVIGEEWIPGGIRSFSNPSNFGQPDTYLGNSWVPAGGGDNGGVHTNSGIQNHWFFRLSQGGSGTNDNGDQFNVTGIGPDKAGAIAFRNLTVYLTGSSEHADARYFAIQSAIDLYGSCSNEMQQVMNAWHAVGVGGAYTQNVEADFVASRTSFCTTPAYVSFSNHSTGAVSYLWKFGDGATSTDVNPTHVYNFPSSYNVQLIATDCAGIKDTLFEQELIVVDFNQPCEIYMPNNASSINEACEGTLKDSGGDQDYLDNNVSYVTISPNGATDITLTFTSFEFATGGDYIAIYDGPDENAPNIGFYNGTALPNGGTITSSGGALTIKEVTNGFGSFPGFEASWSCFVSNDPTIDVFQNLRVYPNPTSGILNVIFDYEGTADLKVEVADLYGKVHKSMTDRAANRFETQMDVSNLAAGIYLLRINNGQTTLTKKIVIQ